VLIGTIVGGIVGGLFGGLGALISGTSVSAGILSGALTGGAIGFIGDNVYTGGFASLVGTSILCAGASALGNVANQYMNYTIETGTAKVNPESIKGLANNISVRDAKRSERRSFGEYIDYDSVAMSALSAGAFAPISLGVGNLVSSAFQGTQGGIVELVSKGMASAMFEINNSSFQMIAERAMEVIFE